MQPVNESTNQPNYQPIIICMIIHQTLLTVAIWEKQQSGSSTRMIQGHSLLKPAQSDRTAGSTNKIKFIASEKNLFAM